MPSRALLPECLTWGRLRITRQDVRRGLLQARSRVLLGANVAVEGPGRFSRQEVARRGFACVRSAPGPASFLPGSGGWSPFFRPSGDLAFIAQAAWAGPRCLRGDGIHRTGGDLSPAPWQPTAAVQNFPGSSHRSWWWPPGGAPGRPARERRGRSRRFAAGG